MATSCEELTHWKGLWCWEGLGAGGEGDNRAWDVWMASLTRWTWVWVNSGSWWWTGRPGVLWFMGSQRVGHDWATDLIWSEVVSNFFCDPMDCSPPGSSVHGISQSRKLELVAISFSRGSSWPRDQIHVSSIGMRILYHWATWEAQIMNMDCWKFSLWLWPIWSVNGISGQLV